MKRFIVLYLFLISCVVTHAQGTGTVGFVETSVVIEEGVAQIRLGVERLTSNLQPANVSYRLLNSNAKNNEERSPENLPPNPCEQIAVTSNIH